MEAALLEVVIFFILNKSVRLLSLSFGLFIIIQSILLSFQLQINFFITFSLSVSLAFTFFKNAASVFPNLYFFLGCLLGSCGEVSMNY